MSASEKTARLEILVIDDDPKILASVRRFLKGQGHSVRTAADGRQGLEELSRAAADVVITDVRMPGMDGFEVLREVRRSYPGTETIVITGYRDIENAFTAMREGAFDFFTKPFKVQDLDASLRRTLRFRRLQKERDQARERLDRIGEAARDRYSVEGIIGSSRAIQAVRDQVRQVARAEATSVLICGETGTGKELVARAIHAESARARRPMVTVDCSAVPEALAESQFFGHVRGAFTDAKEPRQGYFELAEGGTLFLDEIGDMALAAQAMLLRALEERRVRPLGGATEIEVDVRVISASNQDLETAVTEGKFRKDLYYRLNAYRVDLPPLRERSGDIEPIANAFVARYAGEMRKPVRGIAPEALAQLQAHAFPGNVRELRNLVERAVIVAESDLVAPGDFADPGRERAAQGSEAASDGAVLHESAGCPEKGRSLDLSLVKDLSLISLERKAIREALRRCDGNKTAAAKLLGISRAALRRRVAGHDS